MSTTVCYIFYSIIYIIYVIYIYIIYIYIIYYIYIVIYSSVQCTLYSITRRIFLTTVVMFSLSSPEALLSTGLLSMSDRSSWIIVIIINQLSIRVEWFKKKNWTCHVVPNCFKNQISKFHFLCLWKFWLKSAHQKTFQWF